MSEPVKITLPKLGESIVSATVVQWFKKEGDRVALDEPLLEVSTDKVNSEIPSPVGGVLQKIVAKVDEELEVGELLALISLDKEGAQEAQNPAKGEPESAPLKEDTDDSQKDFLSPSVMRLLQEKGIPLSEIDQIPRTGQGGRLSKKDVEAYALKPKASPKQECASMVGTERVKMTPMRKAIADNMVKSFYGAPHASLITEVDVTDVLAVIEKNKQPFFEKHQAKLTITAFTARAIAKALKAFPLINSSLEGDTIVLKHFVNLGIAVSVDQGVMVPVLKRCDEKPLEMIAQEISALARKTREHTLTPDDTQDGTITMTNFGMTGTMIGIPIIRYPEVAIVGLGAINKKVAAMEDDSVSVRKTMFISLTFDHRVLDGIYGCSFINQLKENLEKDLSL